MGLDPSRIQHLAKLSRLSVTEEEVSLLATDLTRILEHVGTLKDVNTPEYLENRPPGERREDVPSTADPRELLSLSQGCIQTASGERFVEVPTVVDKDK